MSTRGPISNELFLVQAAGDYAYSAAFWLPAALGLPIPPELPRVSQVRLIPIEETFHTFA